MTFRVVWTDAADEVLRTHDHLAWEKGADPTILDRAADQIEDLLTRTPEFVGESRADPERVLIVEPLSVIYEVFPLDLVVLIYEARVWYRS